MTTPDVPLRLELEIEVPGTPEQVWDALATAAGISAWFMPTESEERAGGRLVTHMGPDADLPADITGWDPPRRFAYEEDIASLSGRVDAQVTPLTTEFLVEARSGGTCVVRVVSSAFGVGADWEQEFVDEMAAGWLPFFEQLRLYLRHFPGQRATTFTVDRVVPGDAAEVQRAVTARLGDPAVGARIELDGAIAVVEQLDPVLLARLESPVPGMLRIATGGPHGSTEVIGYLFPPAGAGTDELVDAQRSSWAGFLEGLTSEVSS
jgi:uncharacterized protein YndB with AHSA1/START domain